MEKKVFEFIKNYSMIDNDDLVVAGVSGGADSMCLLDLLIKYRKKKNYEIAAVHVNHMIRGAEAERDEEFVKKYCIEMGVEIMTFHVDVLQMAEKLHLSSEEAGRKARYDSFNEVCQKLSGGRRCRIAVAHHANDQAETVLFNVMRGSGIKGAAGIKPVSKNIIRPLLGVTRRQIEEYLGVQGIAYVTDSTNLLCDYSRNKLRNVVIPYIEENINSNAVENIGLFAGIADSAWNYLEKTAAAEYSSVINEYGNVIMLDEAITKLDDIIGKLVIMRMFERMTGTLKDMGYIHVNMVIGAFAEKTGTIISLPYGLRVSRGYKGVYVYHEGTDIYDVPEVMELEGGSIKAVNEEDVLIEVVPWDKNIKIPLNDYTKIFDYDKIKGNLCVRRRMPGDYIILSPKGGKKLLKDYFIDCKIPARFRDSIVLVADGSHVLWVIGYRDSAGCRIDDNTRTAVRVQVSGRKNDGQNQ